MTTADGKDPTTITGICPCCRGSTRGIKFKYQKFAQSQVVVHRCSECEREGTMMELKAQFKTIDRSLPRGDRD